MVDLSNVEFAPAFGPLFQKYRFKTFWGGRGGGKSWQVARYLIIKAITEKHRIACLREFQTSIRDSVYQTLKEQIVEMGLAPFFQTTMVSIRCPSTGSEFIFKGMHANIDEAVRSMEGVTIVWIEEGQLVSAYSWETLIPSVRREGSEIITTFNPFEEEDPTYKLLVLNQPPDSVTVKVGWRDNPWFPKILDNMRRWLLDHDPDAYEHVWEGSCRVISSAVIFRGRYDISTFDMPTDPPPDRLFHGLDFGFANDPLAMTRFWITGKPPNEEMWIDAEAVAPKVELDEMAAFLDRNIPTARSWPIKADNSRPETISYLRRQGFNVEPAEKWAGSVEDGIAHLKGFKKIHIHQRCKHHQQEARLYCYKVDKKTGEVLPKIVDKNNHCWDADRYGLDGYIQRRGGLGVWERLI